MRASVLLTSILLAAAVGAGMSVSVAVADPVDGSMSFTGMSGRVAIDNGKGDVDIIQTAASMAQASKVHSNAMVYVRWGACELNARIPSCVVHTR